MVLPFGVVGAKVVCGAQHTVTSNQHSSSAKDHDKSSLKSLSRFLYSTSERVASSNAVLLGSCMRAQQASVPNMLYLTVPSQKKLGLLDNVCDGWTMDPTTGSLTDYYDPASHEAQRLGIPGVNHSRRLPMYVAEPEGAVEWFHFWGLTPALTRRPRHSITQCGHRRDIQGRYSVS